MTEDRDLIDEIRAVRRRLWEEHGGSVEGFASWVNEREALHPERFRTRTVRGLTEEEIAEIDRMLGK